MKFHHILTILFLLIFFSGNSQEYKILPDDFNNLSIEGNIGFTKPVMNFSDGYFDDRISPLATEFGLRYMLNEYFGLKLDLAYNQYTSAPKSIDFRTDQYRISMQGVINAGRLLKFQQWTQTFNLLAHGGLGIGSLKYHEPTYSTDIDDVVNLVGGLTGQIRISDRVALNMGVNAVGNFIQNHAFDGGDPNGQKFGLIVNGTAGLSFYLGKKKKHADWYIRKNQSIQRLKSESIDLNKKIDKKHDNITSTSLNTKQLETEIAKVKEYIDHRDSASNKDDIENSESSVFKLLAENGYLNFYFDFDSYSIQKPSFSKILFLRNYLEKHSDTSIVLEGYADEKGDEEYNLELSEKRAIAIKKYLIDFGIAGNRIIIEAKGKDQIFKNSPSRIQPFARRVSIRINEIGS
ncbi:OmpA family protein [Sunxiuqinia sp. A32]|uniref:OmpA family protein n=1 Tax=Sunxiuqinia sp. A32 TaxID=3461496 RepID=UPI004045D814